MIDGYRLGKSITDKQDVLLKVAAIIESNGAEIAFPTHTLHIESAPDGVPAIP